MENGVFDIYFWLQWRYLQIISQMIIQQLVRQVTGEQQNDRIYKIDLNNRLLTRINGLKPFSKLRCLQLDFNRIGVIENLQNLTDLRQLHLQYNEIQKIAGLDNNKMLTYLALGSNKIQKLQNLGHLIKLQTLILDKNCIQKITGLQTLKDLKYLSLNQNQLISIDSLPAFSKLEALYADHNKIKKISPAIFAKSTKMLKLNLSNNLLQQIAFVNNLTSLQELNVSNNKIINIQIGPLKNLQYLNVNNNKIQKLPKLSIHLPQLSIFKFAYNQIISQYQIIQSLSQAQMLVQVDYRGNPMQLQQFAQTLYKIYGFDRINQVNYNKPGTRYLNQSQHINKILHEQGLGQIENDEDVRKIIMSGFYNDDLQAEMTGIKPDRPHSGRANRGPTLNFQDMERSYNQIIKNNNKIDSLRNQCLKIFKQNNITIDIPTQIQYQQGNKNNSSNSNSNNNMNNNDNNTNMQLYSSKTMITESKNLTYKTSSINTYTLNEIQNKNEQNINKWKQLKNKQKNFNIRGAVRRVSGSQQKIGSGTRQGSSSKILERPQLMRTQLNPPRWNNDPNLMKTTQVRPLSSKKRDK